MSDHVKVADMEPSVEPVEGGAANVTPPESAIPTPPDLAAVQRVVTAGFPTLYHAVELGLSTCATLLLAQHVNPVAVIYVGPSSSGKTTVTSMFEGCTIEVSGREEALCYRSDGFTPAAFVSQAANVSQDKLAKVDLLPRIKEKVLLTPELATIFRGKDEDLSDRLSVLTQVLDGQGRQIDGGVHGRRGYPGEHRFAWLGCTTPFPKRVWQIMGQLGSRLFFLLLEAESGGVTVADLLAGSKGPSYTDRLARCKKSVASFVKELFRVNGGIRGVTWDPGADDPLVLEWIARLALVLVAMRSARGNEGADSPVVRENPHRAHAVLTALAGGHALVCGRRALTPDDVPMIARVTMSSMPPEGAAIFRALVNRQGVPMGVEDARVALGVRSKDKARDVLRDLDRLGVMEFHDEGQGKAGYVAFHQEWSWCASSTMVALLAGQPAADWGVCEPLRSSQLVNRLSEREGEEGHGETHTSRIVAGVEDEPAAVAAASDDPIRGLMATSP